jgi:hypothetical protein
MPTINRIYDPVTIRIMYFDDFGVKYPQPPAGAEVIDAPYTYPEAMAELRLERDARLTACDWTQLPDVPLTPAAVAQWRVYRHDLRNVPELVESLGWDGAVNWPTPPK